MAEKPIPKVDPYPEPVALTALNLTRINRLQAEKGRTERLARLARRNRDVAWLLAEHQRLARPRPVKVGKLAKVETP